MNVKYDNTPAEAFLSKIKQLRLNSRGLMPGRVLRITLHSPLLLSTVHNKNTLDILLRFYSLSKSLLGS